MIAGILKFFRRRKLARHASDVPTGLLPLKQIRTAAVLMDVDNPEYDVLKEKILNWFKVNGIKGEIWYIDFRKLDKSTLLLTSIQTTIIRKELNWLGAPPMEKIRPLLEETTDLFISLTDKNYFTNILLSKCSRARFKIGRLQLDGETYDMVIKTDTDSLNGNSALKVFEAITDYLTKIILNE